MTGLSTYESVILLIILTFCLFGFLEIIKHLILRIMAVGASEMGLGMFIVEGEGCCEDLEFRVRSIAIHRFFMGLDAKIVIMDYGLDEEALKIAEILRETINGVEIKKSKNCDITTDTKI